MVDGKTKAMIWALYENEQMSKSDIGRKLGVSRNTVYKVLNTEKYKDEQTSARIKKISDEHTQSLIESLVADKRPKQIIDKYLDILNDDETIQNELKTSGIRTIVGAMKILVENQIKIKELNKKPERIVIENNISEIVKLMNNTENKEINPEEEIKEFQSEMVQ